jgi:predicted DNA-binding WGR domain protein
MPMNRQPNGQSHEECPGAIVLYRIDATKRMQRFYRLDIQPDLFGAWCFVREWGRIGSSGQTRYAPFLTQQEAQSVLDKHRRVKERRGYEAAL